MKQTPNNVKAKWLGRSVHTRQENIPLKDKGKICLVVRIHNIVICTIVFAYWVRLKCFYYVHKHSR